MSQAIKDIMIVPGTKSWIQKEQLRETLSRNATRQEDNPYNTWKITVL